MKAKKSPADVSPQDVISFMRTRSDFAFEMLVTSHVMTVAHRVEHGGSYDDPLTAKVRQFDIRAKFEDSDRTVMLAIECKNYDQGHLVVSTVPRRPVESWMHVMDPSPKAGVIHLPNPRALSPSPLYPVDGPVGKATDYVQRARNGEDLESRDAETFDRCGQALSSAHAMSADVLGRSRRGRFVLAMLVVPDGKLWSAGYSPFGERLGDATQVDHVSLYADRIWAFPTPIGGNVTFGVSHLDIVTVGHLKPFLLKATSAAAVPFEEG